MATRRSESLGVSALRQASYTTRAARFRSMRSFATHHPPEVCWRLRTTAGRFHYRYFARRFDEFHRLRSPTTVPICDNAPANVDGLMHLRPDGVMKGANVMSTATIV